jgi:hypothetical protein
MTTTLTTVPAFADLPREVVDKLYQTSLRELSHAAAAFVEYLDQDRPDRPDQPALAINAMRRAIAAYDALATEQPSAADFAFLAEAALDWEAGASEDFRPPATADELTALRARLEVSEQLICLLGSAPETGAAA